jgi:hypothetical protein
MVAPFFSHAACRAEDLEHLTDFAICHDPELSIVQLYVEAAAIPEKRREDARPHWRIADAAARAPRRAATVFGRNGLDRGRAASHRRNGLDRRGAALGLRRQQILAVVRCRDRTGIAAAGQMEGAGERQAREAYRAEQIWLHRFASQS